MGEGTCRSSADFLVKLERRAADANIICHKLHSHPGRYSTRGIHAHTAVWESVLNSNPLSHTVTKRELHWRWAPRSRRDERPRALTCQGIPCQVVIRYRVYADTLRISLCLSYTKLVHWYSITITSWAKSSFDRSSVSNSVSLSSIISAEGGPDRQTLRLV